MGSEQVNHRTLAFAAIALSKIVEQGLPADPQSFEFWYTYATGQNQKLNDDVDELLRCQGKLTDSDLSRLFSLHILSARTTSHLNTVASKLTDEVAEVVWMINAAASSVERYDGELHENATAVEKVESEGEIKVILQQLIRATKSMERENNVLKEQLEVSKSRSEKLKSEIEQIRVESMTDPLTLIGNRQYFDETLEKSIAKAQENEAPLTLLLVDIDHFKQFNDQYGHLIGDDVLRLVASRLKSSVRDGEVARYGGEEFGVILYNKSPAIGRLIAERIRMAIESAQMKARVTDVPLARITVSIGVAELRPKVTSADLIRSADQAMYAAKRAGRNCVIVEEASVQANRAVG